MADGSHSDSKSYESDNGSTRVPNQLYYEPAMDGTSMSLFGGEADFSLFGGDLLLPLPATVYATDEGSVTAPPPDGCGGLKPVVDPLSDVLTLQSDHLSLGPAVLSRQSSASDNPLDEWLDTPMDLFDLVGDDPQTVITGDLTQSLVAVPDLKPAKEHIAETRIALSTEGSQAPHPHKPEQPAAVAALHELSGQDSTVFGDLGLFDFLTSDVPGGTSGTLDVSKLSGLELEIGVDDRECHLSAMSPEDVETILSSGPASPESSLSTEESFNALMSSVLSTQPDHSVSSSSSSDVAATIDSSLLPADLLQLSQMVEPSDTTSSTRSQTVEKYHVSKSRATPYQRSSERSRRAARKTESDSAASDDGGASSSTLLDRKLRKKQQNKDAATRYRQKKKQEQQMVNSEVEQLEEKNTVLKNKVDQMTKEIEYLKNLLADVYEARAQKSK